jgi:hypothetical protein
VPGDRSGQNLLMPSYVRYQSPVPDRRGRRIGIFGLVNMLGHRGYLSAEEEEFGRTTNAWYDAAYTSDAPGRVLYEDEHQVVVVPADDPGTVDVVLWLPPKRVGVS